MKRNLRYDQQSTGLHLRDPLPPSRLTRGSQTTLRSMIFSAKRKRDTRWRCEWRRHLMAFAAQVLY